MTLSFAQHPDSRTNSVAVSTSQRLRLVDPECAVCGRESVGAVEYGEENDPFCDQHCVEALAAAIRSNPAVTPTVIVYDPWVYSPWTAA